MSNRVGPEVTLQAGDKPKPKALWEDPNASLEPSSYHRARVQGCLGAMPSETFQYDIVYATFCEDKEFWENWKVVDCARRSPQESISQENASIRVVMDLPSSQKLYPTAYTPGFATIPRHVATRSAPREPQKIPGLPPGYSVALDVHILEDARIMLDHQKNFRGRVDPSFEWLAKIVDKLDRQKPASDRDAVVPASSTRELPTLITPNLDSMPESKVRLPIGALPFDCSVEGASEGLLSYSDMYGSRARVAKHVGVGAHQVYAENMLVSAFSKSPLGLPPRDSGSWSGGSGTSGGKQDQPSNREDDTLIGKALDRRLESLLDRTLDENY